MQKSKKYTQFIIKTEITFEIKKRSGGGYDILIMHIYPAKYGDRRINLGIFCLPLVSLGLWVAKPINDYFIFCQLLFIKKFVYICKVFWSGN